MKRLNHRAVVVFLLFLPLSLWAKPDLNALISKLSSSSPKVRAQAALVLGGLKAKNAVLFLIDHLKDPKSMVRGTCARALGMIGDDRALFAVSKMGKDTDHFVRKWVIWATCRLVHRDTEMQVTFREPDSGTPGQRLAIKDGLAEFLLKMKNWSMADTMDFAEDKQDADMGIDDEPTPTLILRSGLHKDKDGKFFIEIRGSIVNTDVGSVICPMQKQSVDRDGLSKAVIGCMGRFVNRLFKGCEDEKKI